MTVKNADKTFSRYFYKENGAEFVIKRCGYTLTAALCVSFLFLGILSILSLQNVPDTLLVFVGVAIMYFTCMQWEKESVLAIASVGINIKTTNKLGMVQADFFELDKIKDVVVIEAISLQSVICYLAIILNGTREEDEKVYPLFMNSKPCLGVLKTIYRDIHEILEFSHHDNQVS